MAEQTQSVAFLEYFSGVDDPRQAGKVLYPLPEIMLLVLCGGVQKRGHNTNFPPLSDRHAPRSACYRAGQPDPSVRMNGACGPICIQK